MCWVRCWVSESPGGALTGLSHGDPASAGYPGRHVESGADVVGEEGVVTSGQPEVIGDVAGDVGSGHGWYGVAEGDALVERAQAASWSRAVRGGWLIRPRRAASGVGKSSLRVVNRRSLLAVRDARPLVGRSSPS